MTTSLRDSQGAPRRPGRRRQDAWAARYEAPIPPILRDPRASLGDSVLGGRRRSSGLYDGGRRRRRLSPFDALLVLAVVLVALFLLNSLWSATRVRVSSTGLERTDALTFGEAQELDVRITVSPAGQLDATTLTLDGTPLTDAERTKDGFRWVTAGPLTAGSHRLELVVPRPILPSSTFRWDFVVDATPPRLSLPSKLPAHGLSAPVVVKGRLDDPSARLTADGSPVAVDEAGRFTLRYPRPPAGPIVLAARDEAGHVAKREVFVPVKRPPVRGVHMSAISWRTKSLRDDVFAMIDSGAINTVELDLKDEGGEVGYDSSLPLARRIGAAKDYYDLRNAVTELHDRGVRVVGRIVVYRDPILADWAWSSGRKDWVVQRPDGSRHGAYGGFTNMAAEEVNRYNLAIASEAVAAGVDEILWDYIRRPEGALGEIVFPGMPSTDEAVERGVVGFLSSAHSQLRAKGVFSGASVFGIAADRPAAVGQNIPQIARHVDYLAPMVYPSLWVPGEYRVPDPARMPFQIVARSLEAFKAKAKGTHVHFTPWLQDFTLGPTYGDAEVRAQIDGAAAVGITDWLLWSPRVRYHPGRLPQG
jgi:hypothetical protein